MDGVVSIPLPGNLPGASSALRNDANQGGVWNRFVVGPENALVEVVVRAVLDRSSPEYNPVLFYGPSGTGKSHLVMGLAAAWKSCFPERPVRCTTAHDFARELIDAVEAQATDEFHRRHRGACLLVMEDIGRLADKLYAQEELIRTLDAIVEAGHRVLLTASLPAVQIPGLVPGLRSRLTAGLSVPLTPPSLDTRLVILEQFAAIRGLCLSKPVMQIIADGCSTVPELLAVLMRLQLQCQAEGQTVNNELACRCLARPKKMCSPSLDGIVSATARVFSMPASQLRGRSRRRAVVTARGVAMYLARKFTDHSLAEIGRYFGGRDHTTVLHGCRKTATLMQREPTIQQTVRLLKEGLD